MSRFHKKGVELTMNTVIIAVMVLLVLLVIAFIFLGGTKSWIKGTNCADKGGECLADCAAGQSATPWSCDQKNTKCCVSIINTGT